MNEIINVNGIDCYEEDGVAYLKLETVARGLGFIQTQIKKGKKYESIRWERIEQYLSEFGFPQKWGKDDFIPENIFYRLAMKAKSEAAEAFQSKVADQVIPSIRKHGMYITSGKVSELLADPEALFQIVCNYRDERQARLKAEAENAQQKQLIAEYQPKAVFADSVAASSDTILVRELAKIICQNGVKIGQNRLFRWMRENGFLIRKSGHDYNMPTQYSLEHGLMCVSESSYIDAYGEVQLCFTPRVTAKGQLYFVNKFLNKETCA